MTISIDNWQLEEKGELCAWEDCLSEVDLHLQSVVGKVLVVECCLQCFHFAVAGFLRSISLCQFALFWFTLSIPRSSSLTMVGTPSATTLHGTWCSSSLDRNLGLAIDN